MWLEECSNLYGIFSNTNFVQQFVSEKFLCIGTTHENILLINQNIQI